MPDGARAHRHNDIAVAHNGPDRRGHVGQGFYEDRLDPARDADRPNEGPAICGHDRSFARGLHINQHERVDR